MIVAAVLLGYAAVLAVAGAPLLRRARWVDRAPRFGILAWQAVSVSLVASTVFGGVALMVPTVKVGGGFAAVFQSCLMALQARYATPYGAAMAGAGAGVVMAVIVRGSWCLARFWWDAARGRRRHAYSLTIVGRRGAAPGAVVIENDRPAGYCVAGRHGQVVLTTAAMEALDCAQLRAVLAHERAHLEGHHHLAVGAATVLGRAFPGISAFASAETEIARLVELAADDAAARAADRLTVAEALLAMGGGIPAAPVGALAIGASPTGARVRRLLAEGKPLRRRQLLAGTLALVAAMAVPIAVLIGPAVTATAMQPCPLHPNRTAVATQCPYRVDAAHGPTGCIS